MKRKISGGIVSAIIVVACVMIYEDLTVDSPRNYGGGASYSTTLVFGSSPRQFGIGRESYWTDQTGSVVIVYGDMRSLPSGYKHYVHANLLIGAQSFRLPVRPWVVGLLAVVVMSAGYILAFRRPQSVRGIGINQR